MQPPKFSYGEVNGSCRRVLTARFELGQKEYGEADDNQGFLRDNTQDMFEELADAWIIGDICHVRLLRAGDNMLAHRQKAIMNDILKLAQRVEAMHRRLADDHPEFIRDPEGLVRPAYLLEEIQPVAVNAN